MIERTGKPIVIPEGSSDEVVEAIRSLADEAESAEKSVRERLLVDAARRLADKTTPGDA